jgi:hypothetical protein
VLRRVPQELREGRRPHRTGPRREIVRLLHRLRLRLRRLLSRRRRAASRLPTGADRPRQEIRICRARRTGQSEEHDTRTQSRESHRSRAHHGTHAEGRALFAIGIPLSGSRT